MFFHYIKFQDYTSPIHILAYAFPNSLVSNIRVFKLIESSLMEKTLLLIPLPTH
jgi:hypothetical protein